MSFREQSFFKGKRVTVQGLGLLGRSIGDCIYIANNGGLVTVTDMKSEEQLRASIEKLQTVPNIIFHLGVHRDEDFVTADMIIKSAGVPQDSPYIKKAEDAGVPVYMSTALAAQFATEKGVICVGVTGTRGKTTVTHAIAHLLRSAGHIVHIGGNVRGVSTLALLPELQPKDILVLELDSWQLQGFRTLGISPEVAVFTNLMPDHQNYYKDMDSYFFDKAAIFAHQKKGDALFSGSVIASRIREMHPLAELVVPEYLARTWSLKIHGAHNVENISLAVAAAQAVDIRMHGKLTVPESVYRTSAESFEGVEGRLQFVREIRGVHIYNDNNATTPEATIAALEALHIVGKKNILLIAGGSDKGLPFEMLAQVIEKTCASVFLLEGSGTARLHTLIPGARLQQTLQGCVFSALQLAQTGDIVLFSPACASFGLFVNEYDRNDQFLKIVSTL